MNTCYKYAINNANISARSFKSTGESEAKGNTDSLSANFDPQVLIDKIIDNIQAETSKEYNKTAIAAGGGVILLSLLVAALNPRVSTKLIEKLKILKSETLIKLEKSKGNFLSSKFYEFCLKVQDFTSRTVSFAFNGNSIKDTYFKKLCTEKKTFHKVKKEKINNNLQKADNMLLKVLKKPHEWITKIADNLAKYSVKLKYKKSAKKMKNLEELIKKYSENLPQDKKILLDEKLEELKALSEPFNEKSVLKRLVEQEKIMDKLNEEVRQKFYDYMHGFSKKIDDNVKYINDNLIFWARDILKSDKEILNKEGKLSVDKILGSNETKGVFKEITEIFNGSLSEAEEALLKKKMSLVDKKLRNANKNECENYFDKKRDLVLGSAPTDIVSAILGITAGSIVIASAKDKDEKVSRLLTKIIPVLGGMGTSFAMTAMLISGPKGMLIGAVAGGLMSKIGSGINKLRIKLKNDFSEENKNMEASDV